MPYFTKDQILAQIDAALAREPERKTLVFACNWCSYAGADQAGVEKIQYPPSSLIIRTMCSARVEEDFVMRAFEKGAGAVLVTGCRLTEKGSDCHYNYANVQTEKRFKLWRRKLDRQGMEGDRLQLAWISASEGKEFARKITEMDEIVRRLTGAVAEEGVAMVSEYTRTGRKKLWFDLISEAGIAVGDDDIIVLNDDAWEQVMAATHGQAAACFQCGVCSATCPWGLVRPEPVDHPSPCAPGAAGRARLDGGAVAVHDVRPVQRAVSARRRHLQRDPGAEEHRLEREAGPVGAADADVEPVLGRQPVRATTLRAFELDGGTQREGVQRRR